MTAEAAQIAERWAAQRAIDLSKGMRPALAVLDARNATGACACSRWAWPPRRCWPACSRLGACR